MEGSRVRKALQFLAITFLIYGCYISSGVYHEKILKHLYVSDTDKTATLFDAPIVFTFFPQLVCTLLGWGILGVRRANEGIEPVVIPWRKVLACSMVINVSMMTYNKAVQDASFPAVVMVKSCSLLSVILVALFCSRVKDQSQRLDRDKLWIGVLVSLGIFLFNYFKDQEVGNDHSISYLSTAFLLVSLMGDGLLPDLQAQIKTSYKPGVIDMYFQINRMTCCLALIWAAVTLQLPQISEFVLDHSELQWDLLYFSILNAVGQLAIYRMIKLFKQHIAPFVIATRKCITVIVNIIHFGHSVNQKQIAGMILVFAAIMLQVFENYKKKAEKESAIPVVEMNPLPQSQIIENDLQQNQGSSLSEEIKCQIDPLERVSKQSQKKEFKEEDQLLNQPQVLAES